MPTCYLNSCPQPLPAAADSKTRNLPWCRRSAFGARDLNSFSTYEAAYHQFDGRSYDATGSFAEPGAA